jgi:GMP synthase-like glutamine amidotransferase
MRAVCLKHVGFEGPGAFATHLTARGVSLERHLVPEVGLPDDPGDLLIVMGGPMSVNDPDPWIEQETAFIHAAMLSGMPVLGICLGSQFMAKALGARVRPGRALELGMTPIRLTEGGRQDPVFGAFPETLSVFQWHGEVFDLPETCVALAGSAVAPFQAFRYGPRAYGLLFHLEMEQTGIKALCAECAPDLNRAGLTADQVLSAALPHLPSLHNLAARLLDHLLSPAR